MKKSTFISPYNKQGKANYKTVRKAGVYLIKENSKLVYIGMSVTDVYKTMYRHFQTWNDRQQPERVTYKSDLKRNNYTVRIIYCTSKQASALETALIIKHKPRDNENKYNNYKLNSYDKQVIETYNNTDIFPF